MVLVGGAEITTVDNLQYSYRPVPVGGLHVEVRAPSNAHIALTSANHETEPMYEILLGGWENSASVIRYNRQKPDKVHHSYCSDFYERQEKQKLAAFPQDSPIKQKRDPCLIYLHHAVQCI
jgi:hypothetical protein